MADTLEEKRTLLSMARTFRTDIQDIQQKGAGYYSCDPFVSRHNKLLSKARELFAGSRSAILDSFDEIESTASVDPADKMKITQLVLIELGQLIAFMESVIGQQEAKEEAQADAPSSEETSGKDSARGESGAAE